MAQSTTGTIRAYRMKSSHRAVCIVLLAAGIFFFAVFLVRAIWDTEEVSLPVLLFPILFVLFGVFLTVRSFGNVLTLTQTSIELQTPFGRRALPFDKISGTRRYLAGGGGEGPEVWHIKLESNDDRFQSLDFEESYYTLDEYFDAWFRELPDLDAHTSKRLKTSNFGMV